MLHLIVFNVPLIVDIDNMKLDNQYIDIQFNGIQLINEAATKYRHTENQVKMMKLKFYLNK
jgi:hypothetical protein